VLGPGEWWACEHPERPPELNRTVYCFRCDRCRIALDAARRNGALDRLADQNRPTLKLVVEGRRSS
jgi:hypothetical protein